MSLTHPDTMEEVRGSDVDPDIRRFHQQISADYALHGDLDNLSLEDARRAAEQVRSRWTAGGPAMAKSVDLVVPATGTPIRIHYPQGCSSRSAAMIYVHGGGWTLFSIDTHDRLMREYAHRSGVAVVGVEYSLAPEAKFPRQIGEVVALVAFLRERGPSLGLDPARIAVGGDSAGANLSVAANLQLRDSGQPVLAAMLLNYGAFGPAHTPSYRRFSGPEYMLDGEEMDLFWRNYVRDERDLADPLAAPLLADLHGLPPAFFAIAECDILADCNRAMAQRLAGAGGEAEVASYPGATHSFLEAVSIAPISHRALDDAAAWLRRKLKP